MSVATENQLELLLRSHYHGATNIAGIRYQLIYSVLRAMDLLGENGPESVRLEGLEDLDVHGRREVDRSDIRLARECMRVKPSKKAWTEVSSLIPASSATLLTPIGSAVSGIVRQGRQMKPSG